MTIKRIAQVLYDIVQYLIICFGGFAASFYVLLVTGSWWWTIPSGLVVFTVLAVIGHIVSIVLFASRAEVRQELADLWEGLVFFIFGFPMIVGGGLVLLFLWLVGIVFTVAFWAAVIIAVTLLVKAVWNM